MLSDRDITVRATANNLHPELLRCQDIMTPNVIFCFEDQDIKAARTDAASQGSPLTGSKSPAQLGRQVGAQRHRACNGRCEIRGNCESRNLYTGSTKANARTKSGIVRIGQYHSLYHNRLELELESNVSVFTSKMVTKILQKPFIELTKDHLSKPKQKLICIKNVWHAV
jgi:hypothetical protein